MKKVEAITEYNFWNNYLNSGSNGPIPVQLATEYCEAYKWACNHEDVANLPTDPDQLRAAWVTAVNPKLPADVFINGDRVGSTMHRLNVEKGETYHIVVMKDGVNNTDETIKPTESGEILIDVDSEYNGVLLKRDKDLKLVPIAITTANANSLLKKP